VARIESVNVGRERPLDGGSSRTGIYKEPVAGPVRIGMLGVEGDCVADRRHHGGPDQAIYVYLAEDYGWWSERLGREIGPGMFGENLTIAALSEADLAIGDRLAAGPVILEVTAPRIPCNTLATRMGDPAFVKAYRAAERPGVYCRVIAEGEVAAGMEVAYQRYPGERVGAVEMFRDFFVSRTLGVEELRRTLAAPIAARARTDFEGLLAKAERA
jgi:MOSC domain-containing protein YiiM